MAERNPKLIVVDPKDKILDYKSKKECHQGKGVLHRAFVIYIFNNKYQLLIQKRSKYKSLWSGYWDNTCSGHPEKGQEYQQSGEKRLREEFGFSSPLREKGKFKYFAPFGDVGAEREVCAILVGRYNGKVRPDPKEIAEWKWVDLKDLERDMKKNPEKYTPWFKIGLKKIMGLRKNDPFFNLEKIFQGYSKLVEPIIEKTLTSFVDRRHRELVRYQITTGGKRIRPALSIICCQMMGGKTKDILYPAAGLEILHNYTLIVDDIIDHSTFRREQPTCWYKFGKSIAECVGVDYAASLFQTIKSCPKADEISELFAKTMKSVVDGEVLDILFEQKGREQEPYISKHRYKNVSLNNYLKMVSKKTASLIEASCLIGGICAKARKKELIFLKEYGSNLGIAFQIQDDILDIFGKKSLFGKKIGKDIIERKLGNIVVAFALQEFSSKEKKEFLSILKKDKIEQKDLKRALKIISQTGAKERAYDFGKKFINKAKQSLESLPPNKWNNLLREIANFVLERGR